MVLALFVAGLLTTQSASREYMLDEGPVPERVQVTSNSLCSGLEYGFVYSRGLQSPGSTMDAVTIRGREVAGGKDAIQAEAKSRPIESIYIRRCDSPGKAGAEGVVRFGRNSTIDQGLPELSDFTLSESGLSFKR